MNSEFRGVLGKNCLKRFCVWVYLNRHCERSESLSQRVGAICHGVSRAGDWRLAKSVIAVCRACDDEIATLHPDESGQAFVPLAMTDKTTGVLGKNRLKRRIGMNNHKVGAILSDL
jgi:hypothetical protein